MLISRHQDTNNKQGQFLEYMEEMDAEKQFGVIIGGQSSGQHKITTKPGPRKCQAEATNKQSHDDLLTFTYT